MIENDFVNYLLIGVIMALIFSWLDPFKPRSNTRYGNLMKFVSYTVVVLFWPVAAFVTAVLICMGKIGK